MSDKPKKQQEKDAPDPGRRALLKKAGYTAPALVVLATAGHSRKAGAQIGDPPSAPDFGDSVDPNDDELLRELEENGNN